MARRWLVAMVLAAMGFIPMLGATPAQVDTDIAREQALVAMAVNDLFDLAAARDYNTLYDRMHPDSKEAFSRAVALNLFSDVYSRVLVDQSQIVGMEFGSWSWEVNGKYYPDAVAVSIVQQVLDEQNKPTWIEDTVYLAKEQGNWHWFIGSTREFVDQVNEQYAGQTAADESPAEARSIDEVPRDEVIQIVVDDLDEFYGDVVGNTEFTYETPGVMVVAEGDIVMSACGQASTGFYGFYCPLDSTMYLDEPFLLDLVDQGSAFSAAFVIAHEWAHHVQIGIGLERTSRPGEWNELHSIELELMADCFAGAWALDAETRGLVDPGDIETAIHNIVFSLGDPKFIDEYDPQAHGNGEQRVRATLNGYEDGFLGCNILI